MNKPSPKVIPMSPDVQRPRIMDVLLPDQYGSDIYGVEGCSRMPEEGYSHPKYRKANHAATAVSISGYKPRFRFSQAMRWAIATIFFAGVLAIVRIFLLWAIPFFAYVFGVK